MNKINQMGQRAQLSPVEAQEKKTAKKDSGSSFADVLSSVADVALATTATVASVVPGGQLIGLAAGGLYGIKQAVGGQGQGGQGGAQPGAGRDDIDKMWDMQKDNQAYNMEYMALQNQLQSDNRSFSTLSNLMKVRHDTAKSAINNMHA